MPTQIARQLAASLNRLAGVGQVLRTVNFQRIWVAQICANIASASVNFAMVVLVETSLQSSLALSLLLMANDVPAVLFAGPAGALADRFSKRVILIIAMALRAGVLVILILLRPTWPGPVLLSTLILTVFTYSILNQFYGPAEGALIPRLVGIDRLIPANTVVGVTYFATQFVGFVVVGPVLNRLIGLPMLATLAIALLLFSTLLVALLPHDQPPTIRALRPGSLVAEVAQDVRDAVVVIWRDPILVKALGYLALTSMTMLMLGTLGPGFVTRILGRTPDNIGLFLIPAAVGGGLGLVLVNSVGGVTNHERIIDAGILAGGLATLAMALIMPIVDSLARLVNMTAPPALIIGLIALASAGLGLSLACIIVPSQTILQERAPLAMRARIFAAYYTISSAAALLPTFLAGLFGDLLGVPVTLGSIGLLLIGVASLQWLRARLGRHRSRTDTLPPSNQPR